MPNPFIWGNNFHHHHQEEEDDALNHSNPPSPTSCKINSLCKRRAAYRTNRYSKRRLDKFTALLARRRIYSEMGSSNHQPLVRFVFNNSGDCIPDKSPTKPAVPERQGGISEKKLIRDVNKWRRPSCYLPAISILVLMFLVLFGRSAAIMSTCVGWYLLPILSYNQGSTLRSKNMESTLQPRRRLAERR